MRYYSAYNLCIGSDIPLLELPVAEKGGDVEIRVMPTVPNNVRSIEWQARPAAEACFCFPDVGKFLVRGGREVIITPDPQAEPDLLRLYIQGMVLAAVLYQRNLFVLHSSVVNVSGRAVAFTGQVGAGKSSLAAAFHARGYGLIADDNAAIDLSCGQPRVVPAFPSLKVYPDVAASLGYDRTALRTMHHTQIKRAQSAEVGFSAAPLPLKSVYLLERDAPAEIRRLTPVESITEMIRHSVPTRWGVAGDLAHLQTCSRLAESTVLFRARTFTELWEIPGIVHQIEQHQRQLESIGPAEPLREQGNAA